MTDTTEKLLPCPHCPFCGSADIVARMHDPTDSSFCHQFVCRRCNGSSGYFKTESEARAAWNRRVAEKPKWTKEPPTEDGWYMVSRFRDDTRVIPVKCGGTKEEYIETFSDEVYTLKGFCETYPEVQWCRINVPALPEKGEET